MTHEETIKRIQELVPSIMALEFGCEVEALVRNKPMWAEYETGKVIFSHSICRKHKLYKNCNEDCDCDDGFTALFGYPYDGEYEVTFIKGEKYKILGKPITLAVLFQAFENNKTEVELSIFANKILIGHYEKPNQEGYYTKCYWELSKDNFNDQSEETKTFIGGYFKALEDLKPIISNILKS